MDNSRMHRSYNVIRSLCAGVVRLRKTIRDARPNLGATNVTFDKRSKTMPNSITKGTVTEEEISRMVWKAFGEKALEARELKEGYFNIAYRIRLRNRDTVLKIAPSPVKASLTGNIFSWKCSGGRVCPVCRMHCPRSGRKRFIGSWADIPGSLTGSRERSLGIMGSRTDRAGTGMWFSGT